MNKLNLLLFTLPFSLFGIYLSYYHYGRFSYLYYPHDMISIIFSGIKIFLLIGFLNSMLFLFVKKINSKTLYFYYIIAFSALFFIIFHYLVRFSDYNFYILYLTIFEVKSKITQILFYSIPLIFGALIFIISSNITRYKIIKFFSILSTILLIISIYRINNIIDQNSILNNAKKNDYINFNKNFIESDTKSSKKVYFLIFDEFDYKYFVKNINYFPTFQDLLSKSFLHQNFYTPAMYTLDSIPAILAGKSTKKTILRNGELSFITNEGKEIKFNQENSIFGEIEKKGYSSSILGVYQPYCKIFTVKNCYDRFNQKIEKINFSKSLNILFHITYLEVIFGQPFPLNLTNFFNKKKIIIKKDSDLAGTDKGAQSEYDFYHFLVDNSDNFIKLNSDLI